MLHSNGSNGADQLARFREWIGDRDVFMQTFPSAAWCIVAAGNETEFKNAIARLEEKQGDGIYFGINPMKAGTKGVPREPDIDRRRVLFLDVDHPDHDLQIPANDAGKQMSRDTFERAITYLGGKGWPAPTVIDSGNGHHGHWYIDLPNEEKSTELIRSFLQAMRTRFGPLIDTAVNDARRLGRVPGTINRRGEPTPERPHRPCIIINVPELAEVVTAAMIREVIADVTADGEVSSFLPHASNKATYRPGDIFNHNATWAEILEPHGWKIERKIGGEIRWTRPGKNCGVSAASGFCNGDKSGDLLYVFTTNAPPLACSDNAKAYFKFRAYTLLNHGGDYAAAARALAARGYGTPASSARSRLPSDWPMPIPLTQAPAVPIFPLEVFPLPIKTLIEEASNAMNVPTCYVAGPVLTLAGAAIGNARHIALSRTHTETALLYWLTVGPPGTLKTPALKLVRKPFDKIQQEKMDAWKAAMKTWSEAPKAERDECRPILDRLVVSDTTVETLGLILHENHRGVALIRDEMSALIGSFGQYKMGKGSDKQFFLSVWSGDPVTIDRKSERANRGGPLHVGQPFVSVIGGVQPDVLPTIAGESRRGVRPIRDGFLDRFAIVWPDPLPFAGDCGLEVSATARDNWEACVRKLYDLEMVLEQHGRQRAYLVQLNQSGRDEWRRFTERHAAEMNDDLPPHLIGPWSKLKGMTARIALILHMLRWADHGGSEGMVDGLAIHDATKMTVYLKDHARRVHTCMGNEPRLAEARKVARWLGEERLHKFSNRDVYRKFRSLLQNVDEIDAILRILERHNYVTACDTEAGRGRRPSPSWLVNPAIREIEVENR